jgi:hypothetical protein
MAIGIDSSVAPRGQQGLAALVDAVAAASPNDEANWIEWKSAIDPEPEGRSGNDRPAHPGNGEPFVR